MKTLASLTFIFLSVLSFSQSLSIKEYNYTDDSYAVVNSPRSIIPGDTLTFEITIVENNEDDFIISPGGPPGNEYYRGLQLCTPDNNPAIPIIDSCKGFKYHIEFLADSNIVLVYDSSIVNPGASGTYSLAAYFEVDGQDHIDSITFKYVHIVIPCDLAPGSYSITLDEIDDFIGNASFTEETILTLTYAEPEVSIDIPEPLIRDACYSNTVNLDVIIDEGGSECAQYTLFVNNQEEGQFNDTINYAFSYGDWVKVQILGGEDFSDSIQIDESYFIPLNLTSTSHSNYTVLCPNEKVSFEIPVGTCTPNSIAIYKVSSPDAIIDNPENTTFDLSFDEACTVYAKLTYTVNGNDVEIQSSSFIVSQILSAGPKYDFLDTYAFPVTEGGVNLMELEYNEESPYLLPFTNREETNVPLKLGKDNSASYKVYRQPSVAEYLFYRFDIPYTSYPANTISDSMDFNVAGIAKGEGIPNVVTLYYGKRYEIDGGKYCYDSTNTAIYVLRDDVFIPKSAFCSNDDEEVTIEINTDLKDWQSTMVSEDTTVFSFATYAGYNIIIDKSFDENHPNVTTVGPGNTINFTPSDWAEYGNEFKIVAKAEIELRKVTGSDCPQQWYKYGSYYAGQKVYYNGLVYRALQDIDGSGIIFNPHDPIEIQSDGNEVNAIVPIGDPIVIYITPGIHTEYWIEVGTCSLGSTSSMYIETGYANNTFDILDPAIDGRFLDFPINYCMTNKEINLESNYTIVDITGGNGAINEISEDVWQFIPENMLPEGDTIVSDSITLFYKDLYGCAEDTTYAVSVNKNYKVKRNVQISLDDIYCKTNHVFNLTCNYGIDSIWGPGINDTTPYIFSPELAIDESIDSTDIEVYLEYRDNNQCWNDTSFNITIDKEYNVKKDVELNLEELYCPVNDSILLTSNYSIISLLGEGVDFEDDDYTFNPFVALGSEDSVMLDIPLIYRDNNGCLYDKEYNVEVNRDKLVDKSGFIKDLADNYCHVSVDYPIEINDQEFEVDFITGHGIKQSGGKYFYNAYDALLNAINDTLQDTVILKYFDRNGCPYTKIKIVDIDSGNVNATADLLFDEHYCAVNNSIEVENNNPIHNLDSVFGYGTNLDVTDSICYFNPFSVYENAGIDTMVIYSDSIITDGVTAYFKDEKQCPYKKEYNVDVSGSFAENLNGNIVATVNEFCQFDQKFGLVGNPIIDTLVGPGLDFDAVNNQWYLDPSHVHFTSTQQDVDTFITYYYRDNLGCPWSSNYEFSVYARPEPDFSFSELCEGDFTSFTDQTFFASLVDSIDTWGWTFGDLTDTVFTGYYKDSVPEGTHSGYTTGIISSPKHRYPEPSDYDVTLRVESNKGCENQITKTLIIGGFPEVDFTFEGLLQNLGTVFTNNSHATPLDPIVQSTWDWDDGGEPEYTAGINDTVHKFDNIGVRNVMLTSKTHNGCADTISKKVPIFEYIPVRSDSIYEQDFENPNTHGWLSAAEYIDGMTSGWEREEVSGDLQTFPITDGFIWRTGKAIDELFGEDSWVESPGFDISQLDFPVLSIDIYQSVEQGRDGAVVQYTLDDGDNWILLDDEVPGVEEGINWYNEDYIIANPGNQTVTDKVGWSVNLNQWQTARFPMDKVKQQAADSNAIAVRFRVAYASDEGNDSAIYDGFAFDNFRLTSRSRVVLLEQFVNTVDDYSLARQKERWMDKFLSDNPKEAVGMNYHNYIADNYDPLYYLNTPDISARSMEYGAYLEQLTMVDGLHRCVSSDVDEAEAYYRMRSLKDKKFDIDVETSFVDGALQVSGTVTKRVDTLIHTEGTEKSVVRIGLVQKEMVVDDTVFKNVLVELLPMGIGNVARTIPAELEKNDTVQFNKSWYPDNVTTIGQEYRLVVYVQGIWGVDEVHQVWFQDLDNSLIPQVEASIVNSTNDEEGEESFGDDTHDMLGSLQYLRIYPMPTDNDFYLDWQEELEFDVNWQLISMSGQIILKGKIEKGVSKQLIEAEGVPVGVYLLRLHDDGLNYVEKRMVVIK